MRDFFESNKKIIIIGGAVLLAFIMFFIIVGALGKNTGEEEDLRVVTLPAEEQIMVDTYKLSKQITNNLNYTPYYIKSYGGIKAVNSYEPFKLQVDCMNLFVVGRTKMKDIVSAIDQANEITIQTIIEDIRVERQERLDAEFEAEKKEAEEKGKTFNKNKPEADVSDLQYISPYSYLIKLSDDAYNNNIQYAQYEPSYLVNPSERSKLVLILYKYSIPYVQFEFQSVYGTFNNGILQEADWVLTAVQAADCSSFVQKDGSKPRYVGDDNMCISKYNIVMSGNINFAGEGFVWSNTEIIMQALSLKEGQDFTWTSDERNTYYIIKLPADMFFLYNNGDTYYQPIITLTATFDRHTQKCTNWRIDMSGSPMTYNKNVEIEKGEIVSVNIKEKKVDTVDYQKMQDAVNAWVENNSTLVITDQGYYLVDYTRDGELIGKLDNGLFNINSDVKVDGEEYICLEVLKDGSAKYISSARLAKAPNNDDKDRFIEENSVIGTPVYLLMTKENNKDVPLAAIDTDRKVINMQNNTNKYYVYSYEYDNERGYSNVVIIDQLVYDKLPDMYIMSYKLESEEQKALRQAEKENGAIGMKEYIQKLHPDVK